MAKTTTTASGRVLSDRVERILRRQFRAWAPLLVTLILAAIVGKTPYALRLRIRLRRRGVVNDLLGLLEKVLPSNWAFQFDPEGDLPPECRLLFVTSSDAIGVPVEYRSCTRSLVCFEVGDDAVEPTEGWLDLILDEGDEQTLWRANRVLVCATSRGRMRNDRLARCIEWIRERIGGLNLDADVLFEGDYDLPELASVPLHLPDTVQILHGLAHAQTIMDVSQGADGMIRTRRELLVCTATLLARAGAVDQHPDISRQDLDFFVWLDVMTVGRPAVTVNQIIENLSNPTFRDELVKLLDGTGHRVYPANRTWNHHRVYRPLQRLADATLVQRDSNDKEHKWSPSPRFRGYRPGNLLTRLAGGQC